MPFTRKFHTKCNISERISERVTEWQSERETLLVQIDVQLHIQMHVQIYNISPCGKYWSPSSIIITPHIVLRHVRFCQSECVYERMRECTSNIKTLSLAEGFLPSDVRSDWRSDIRSDLICFAFFPFFLDCKFYSTADVIASLEKLLQQDPSIELVPMDVS